MQDPRSLRSCCCHVMASGAGFAGCECSAGMQAMLAGGAGEAEASRADLWALFRKLLAFVLQVLSSACPGLRLPCHAGGTHTSAAPMLHLPACTCSCRPQTLLACGRLPTKGTLGQACSPGHSELWACVSRRLLTATRAQLQPRQLCWPRSCRQPPGPRCCCARCTCRGQQRAVPPRTPSPWPWVSDQHSFTSWLSFSYLGSIQVH